ncbi:MAG: flagellar hook-length control protein FliK [Asticcacaulis sp.]|uniref:flagellar hook-length control protein FliK n=1 Tax=Asticcacaulis sp. TaxID=1872648 RepID=UPI0025BDDED8|nr:flagellar hook-length control protein FliK [Asticcacaulis sp.]MCA1936458.1 flagellar hook-length control protein FliK [Asticcacaulis sp.]
MSADLLPSNATPLPSAPMVATGGTAAASAEAEATLATLFTQALAAVQPDEAGPLPQTVSSETADDTPEPAKGTGELSPDLLAALLGQQAPQPVVTAAQPASAQTVVAEALAATTVPQVLGEGTQAAPALQAAPTPAAAASASASPLVKGAVALPLPTLTGEATPQTTDEGTEDTASDELKPTSDKDTTAETSVTSATKAEARSLSDTLQTLSGALKGASETSASPTTTAQAQPPSQAANPALTQIQAQTLPQNDSGVRFTPPAPTPQDTVRTYSQSAHAAENIAALSAQITRRLGSKSTSFDMELRPTDMGKVEVKLEIAHDGKLTAHLRFDSPVAESEFKGRQDDLRRQLEQAGFQMDDASLSFTSGDQGRGRQYTASQSSDYELTVPEADTTVADAHTLIDAQLMAASADPAFYARLSADGYGPARTLSLSLLV